MTIRYRKGNDPKLDEKFALFKKVNIFAGGAYDDALSKKEAATLLKVWSKSRILPKKLYVHEVLTLVKFTEVILAWRRNRRREVARLRKERARRKLRIAASKGNKEAILKVESIKKADKLRSANDRKKKRKLREKT